MLLAMTLLICGCTSLHQYIDNGFKVGPNYQPPPAPVAPDWIDAADKRVRTESDDLSHWWSVFDDPVLDSLIQDAYSQNLTLRAAGFRVLEARRSWASPRAIYSRKRSRQRPIFHAAESAATRRIIS